MPPLALFLGHFEPFLSPQPMHSDNGPEFVARAIRQWLEVSGGRTLYIEPGAPRENAYSETFISRFSEELLKREVFADLLGHTVHWSTRLQRNSQRLRISKVR